jgi:F-type H+-transporting ATPase subunit delta
LFRVPCSWVVGQRAGAMIRDIAAKRYAEAAYLLAREEGKVDQWSAGLAAMSALFGDKQARMLFENRRVPMAQKQQLVERALAGVDPLVLNLARLLLRRGRTSLGPQIADTFQELVQESKGISHATVTSAVPLTPDDQRAVTQRLRELTGGEVVLEMAVDESILGGLVVRIGDRLIDGSTKSRLLALKRRLAGATA